MEMERRRRGTLLCETKNAVPPLWGSES